MTTPTFALISQGRLFIGQPSRELREIESRFAQDAIARQARHNDSNAWKGRSGVWGNMGLTPPNLEQWNESSAPQRQIHFRSVSRGGNDGECHYLLDMGEVHGLFQYDFAKDQERRLIHRNSFPATDLARHSNGELAISLRNSDGTSNITISQKEGLFWDRMTGGDQVDAAPSWVADNGRNLVFQSAEVLRNAQGHFLRLGPFAVHQVNLDGEHISKCLVADPQSDLLLPKQHADGSLTFIRRPYRAPQRATTNLGGVVMDVLLFPYRLLRAFFGFLNFFSMAFTGKPLTTANGAPTPWSREQIPQMILWGHLLDVKQAMQTSGKDFTANIAPADWVLVQRSPNGQERIIAKHVLAYDRTSDGRFVYSNGTAVFLGVGDTPPIELTRQTMIESVVVLA